MADMVESSFVVVVVMRCTDDDEILSRCATLFNAPPQRKNKSSRSCVCKQKKRTTMESEGRSCRPRSTINGNELERWKDPEVHHKEELWYINMHQ
jgi:hypothetical protein